MTEDRPGFVHGDVIRCVSVTSHRNDCEIADRVDDVDMLMTGAVWPNSPLRNTSCNEYVGKNDPAITITAVYSDDRDVSVILNRIQAKQLIRDIKSSMKLASELVKSKD